MAKKLGFSVLLLVLTGVFWIEIRAHQQPSFPGQDSNKPPEVHHQAHAPQGNQPPNQANQAQFGGEQARDEG